MKTKKRNKLIIELLDSLFIYCKSNDIDVIRTDSKNILYCIEDYTDKDDILISDNIVYLAEYFQNNNVKHSKELFHLDAFYDCETREQIRNVLLLDVFYYSKNCAFEIEQFFNNIEIDAMKNSVKSRSPCNCNDLLTALKVKG